MQVKEFTQKDEKLRIRISMLEIQAILEKHEGTIIVTSNDTYYVSESFDYVDSMWKASIEDEFSVT